MKAVLFDLDGTLVRAGGAGRRALNRAVLDLHGVPEVCSEFSLAGRTDLDNFRLALRQAVRRAPTPKETRAVETAYLQRLPGEVRRAVRTGRYELVAGVQALLAELKRRKDVLIGLGTGNIRPGAEIKLRPSGLLDFFRFGGFGGDGLTRVRVLRTGVARAAALAGARIAPEDVFIIGDTHKDVSAGRAAGYNTGVVTAGFGELEKIRKARPDLLADDFRDLRLWLGWIAAPRNGAAKRRAAPESLAS